MRPKIIAITLFIISTIIALSFYGLKINEDKNIEAIIENNEGSCIVNGICLYQERSWLWYIVGWVFSGMLFAFSVYSYFFDKTQNQLMEYQKNIASSLQEAQKKVSQKDKFEAFISAFGDNEKRVLSAIKENDGILQSTLRYKSSLSKTALSLILKNFEEKGLVHREVSGRTNKVYLKIKY